MASPEPTKEETIKMIVFIKQKVSSMSINDRREILRIIMQSGIDDHKIHSKGDGTQVKFKDLPYTTVLSIYKYMTTKIDTKITELQSLTEDIIPTEE